MRAAKEQNRAVDPDVFAAWAEAAFPAVATRLSRLVTNLRLFDHVAPAVQPGGVQRARARTSPSTWPGPGWSRCIPSGPIMEGVGVNVTVFSYLDTVHVGVQACWDLVPDVDVLAGAMEESLAELVAEADRRDRPVPWWHAELPA